jgi:hypothetical protein
MMREVRFPEIASTLCRLLLKYRFQKEDIQMLIQTILIIQDRSVKSELCAMLMDTVTADWIPMLFSLLTDSYAALPVIGFLLVHCKVEDILNSCDEEILNKNALNSIIDLVNLGNPSGPPIACWIAVNLDEEAVESLIRRVDPKQSYYSSPFSVLWPTCLLFSSTVLIVLIVAFLYRIFRDHFYEVYGCVEVLGSILSVPDVVDDIKSNLLMPVSQDSVLMMDFLVFRHRPYFNEALKRFMNIHDLEVPQEKPLIDRTERIMPWTMYEEIAKIEPLEFCFGMRLKQEDQWVDLQLAKFLFGSEVTRKTYLDTMVAKLEANALPPKISPDPKRFLPQLSVIPRLVPRTMIESNALLNNEHAKGYWDAITQDFNRFMEQSGFA